MASKVRVRITPSMSKSRIKQEFERATKKISQDMERQVAKELKRLFK